MSDIQEAIDEIKKAFSLGDLAHALNDNMETILEALKLAQKTQWRPISEAPKDGMFLGYNKEWYAPICVEYDECNGVWVEVWDEEEVDPTHWMPLPPVIPEPKEENDDER